MLPGHTTEPRTDEEWIKRFIELDAFWRHDDNRLRPHAQLTAKEDGRDHSNGFFNWGMVAQYPEEEKEVAEDLAALLFQTSESAFQVDRVIGPGSGAITLASRLAEAIGELQGFPCRTTFVDKATGKLRVPIAKGERVLACEDTISTGGSVQSMIDVVEAAGGKVLSVIAAVCNRSGFARAGKRLIVPLISTPMENWTPEECPLCKVGSVAIKPKQDSNWQLLHQHY